MAAPDPVCNRLFQQDTVRTEDSLDTLALEASQSAAKCFHHWAEWAETESLKEELPMDLEHRL